MANFIEKARNVRDIVNEINDIDRICKYLDKANPITYIDDDGVEREDYTIKSEIKNCLGNYRELLLDAKLYKGDDK